MKHLVLGSPCSKAAASPAAQILQGDRAPAAMKFSCEEITESSQEEN